MSAPWPSNLLKGCGAGLGGLLRTPSDRFLWHRSLDRHYYGEVSCAVVQANLHLEDFFQVESGHETTFVGVYDGHGGATAVTYVHDHLLSNVYHFATDAGEITENVLRRAIEETERGLIDAVRELHREVPLIARSGTCCLVGIIWRGRLLVANLGDSRAISASLDPNTGKIVADQINVEHNLNSEAIRQELILAFPDDPDIVVHKNGAYRVKGVLAVSRAIGDACLKYPELALGPDYPQFQPVSPITQAVISAIPQVYTRVLNENDRFLVFASDGLWNWLTNEEVIEIVTTNQRRGIAKKLAKRAVAKAAEAIRRSVNYVRGLNGGTRREVHDDITVVVVFVNDGPPRTEPQLAIGVHDDIVAPPGFNNPPHPPQAH